MVDEPIVSTPKKHSHRFVLENSNTCECGAKRCQRRLSAAGDQCKLLAMTGNLCRKHIAADEAEKDLGRGYWNVDRILSILDNPDKTTTLENGHVINNSLLIYRFIVRMFDRQTLDEQSNLTTNHKNGIGFTGADAHLLSDMARSGKQFNEEYRKARGHYWPMGMTVKAAKYAARFLRKYVKTQLVDIASEARLAPLPEAVEPLSPQRPTQQKLHFAKGE